MANAIRFPKLANQYVGVYGTLKSGFSNHSLLGDSPLVDEGWVMGISLYDLGPFPGATRSDSEQPVFVEVYAVDDDTLAALDHLEGYNPDSPHSSLYVRQQMQLEAGPSCWIYLYNKPIDGYLRLDDGIWTG